VRAERRLSAAPFPCDAPDRVVALSFCARRRLPSDQDRDASRSGSRFPVVTLFGTVFIHVRFNFGVNRSLEGLGARRRRP
jgi:hypothetical protein